MRTIEHTRACAEQTAEEFFTAMELHAAQRAYDAAYPSSCRACNGEGAFYFPGVYMYRDGSGEPPSTDICEDCVGKGRCPRCGAQHDEDWEGDVCATCGWRWDAPNMARPTEWGDVYAGTEDVCSCGALQRALDEDLRSMNV